MRNESACCKTKENHRRRRATSIPSARYWDSMECISDLYFAHLMASSLMRAYTCERTSPHVDMSRRNREQVAGKRFFHSTASARGFPVWRDAFYELELAQGFTMVMSSRSIVLLRRRWLSKIAASVVLSIRRGFNLPFCPVILSRKGHVSSTINCTLLSSRNRTSVRRSARLWGRELHPVFVQNIAWRRVVSCR